MKMEIFKNFNNGTVRVRVVNDRILGINNYTTEVAKERDGFALWYPADEIVAGLKHNTKTRYTTEAIESFVEVVNKLTE